MVSGVHIQSLTLVTEISSSGVKDIIPKRQGKNLNLKIIGLHVTWAHGLLKRNDRCQNHSRFSLYPQRITNDHALQVP